MALRSKEFVGKAEGIKSHELSVKSLIESLKGTLSKLGSQKSSIENRISYLYAELAAAENDLVEEIASAMAAHTARRNAAEEGE